LWLSLFISVVIPPIQHQYLHLHKKGAPTTAAKQTKTIVITSHRTIGVASVRLVVEGTHLRPRHRFSGRCPVVKQEAREALPAEVVEAAMEAPLPLPPLLQVKPPLPPALLPQAEHPLPPQPLPQAEPPLPPLASPLERRLEN